MPSSSRSKLAREATDLLAARMRELRERAGLTTVDLAAATGWHRSRVARIEGAERIPSERDIGTWCIVTGAQELTSSLIAALRNLDRLLAAGARTGGRPASEHDPGDGVAALYANTGHIRIFQHRIIPSLLQTEFYARAYLTKQLGWCGRPSQVEAALSERMNLQRFVLDPTKQFTFLLDELALYTRVCARSRMAEQMSWLEALSERPNVSLGVIPSDAELPIWSLESFCMFDADQVRIETLTGVKRRISSPDEVSEYERAFNTLSEEAAYDPGALDLITAAADYWDLLMTERL